jgi:hypothetical protein
VVDDDYGQLQPCADCHATDEVMWSPVFDEWLCAGHIGYRTERLLGHVTWFPSRQRTSLPEVRQAG